MTAQEQPASKKSSHSGEGGGNNTRVTGVASLGRRRHDQQIAGASSVLGHLYDSHGMH